MTQDTPSERFAFRSRRSGGEDDPAGRDPAAPREAEASFRSSAAPRSDQLPDRGDRTGSDERFVAADPADREDTRRPQPPRQMPEPHARAASAPPPAFAPSAGRSGAGEEDLPNIDIRSLMLKLWRGKWIIVASIVVMGLLALIPISRMQPVYRATAKMMFNLDGSGAVDIGQVVLGANSETTLKNQVEILSSKHLIEGVVDRLGLDRNPEFNPILAHRLSEQADAGTGTAPATPLSDAEKAQERRIVTAIVTARLNLLPVDGTRVIELQFTAGDPVTAAEVVNAIGTQYLQDQVDTRLETTSAATTWLAGRVEELRERLQSAEEAVETARTAQSQAAGQGLEITQQQLVAANSSLIGARNETLAARSTVERIAEAIEQNSDFGSVPDFRTSQIIAAYRAEMVSLTSQAGQFTEGSVRLTEIRRRIDELNQMMATEAEQILQSAKTDLASKDERENALVAEIRELEDKALEQSRAQVQIRQLSREADASRVLYESFLNRLKETSAQQDLVGADARVLSAAEPPLGPLAEASQRTMIAALTLGALIGIAIVLIIDKLNNTFRSPAQVEELTGIAVVGTVPAVGRRLHKRDIFRHFAERPKSSLAESIRNLRTSILFSDIDHPPQVVMFTSSVPGEGKSTTSILMAIASQQMGRSSIIVDCDLRLPTLAQLFEDDGTPGLVSVMEGTATLDEAIHRDPTSGLHMLMTKPSEPRSRLNAADILASQRFRDLIAILREHYDMIILDAPPTLVVADARILAPMVDAVVYLARWNQTPRNAVSEGLKDLRHVGAPIAGITLTMIDEQRAASYTYDGYDYHKGRYRDYYDGEPAPSPGWQGQLRQLIERLRHRLRPGGTGAGD